MHLLIALLYLLSEGLADIHILHSHRPRVQLAYSLRIPITYALRIPLTYQGPARTNKVEPLLEASGQYLNISGLHGEVSSSFYRRPPTTTTTTSSTASSVSASMGPTNTTMPTFSK